MFLFIAAVTVVLVVSFLCSVFESVLLSLTRPQVEILTRQGRRAGKLLAEFKANMDVPIAAILILNTAAHTVGAAVAGASYSSVFDPSTLWLFSLLFTLAVLLFTEIIPKTLGVSYASTLASPVAYGIRLLVLALRPLVLLSEKISRSLRGDREVPVTSAEEIRLLAVLGRSEGAVGERTAGMIVGATQLRELRAQDVMLPRESVQFLRANMSRDEVLALIRESGHSRFPFTPTDDVNDITGVVLVKRLFDWLLQHEDEHVDWSTLSEDALVVPASSSLPRLLRTFQESQRHMAIVVDEYGGVDGIATLEDVLEEIVGDIRDESDRPADDFIDEADGSLRVRAAVDLRQLAARLAVPWEPEAEVASIGGLITETLERIPRRGDVVAWKGYELTVTRADRRRVREVRVKRMASA